MKFVYRVLSIALVLSMLGLQSAEAESSGVFNWLHQQFRKDKPALSEKAAAPQPHSLSVSDLSKPLGNAVPDQKPALINGIVAQVGDHVITHYDVAQQRKIALFNWSIAHPNQAMPDDAHLDEQIVAYLIDRQVMVQKAKQENITVDDAFVTSACSGWLKSQGLTQAKAIAALKKQGLTWSDFKTMVSTDLLIQKTQESVLGREINVSDADVKAYQKTQDQQALHVTVEAVHITFKEGASQAVQKAAQAKALRFSKEDPKQWPVDDASNVALSHWDDKPLSDLPNIFSEWIQRDPKGTVLGPIKTSNGYHVLYVRKRETVGPVLAEGQIRRMLFMQALSKKVPEWLETLRADTWVYRVR
jgi:parvulin-like peptidyl-prolyl isomerase